MLFNEKIWQEWCAKIEKKNSHKSYDHFDHRFHFEDKKAEIKGIVSEPNQVKVHAFLPLVKLQIATPRFRYLENEGKKGLETKRRPISYASHLDTYIYSFYSFALGRLYEERIRQLGIDSPVLAYRSDLEGRCNIQFARDVFNYIQKKGPCIAIALDIKGYFDHIDHKLLKEKWIQVLGTPELPPDQYNLFRSLTRYSYVNRNSLLRHYNIQLRKDPRQPTFLDYMGKGSFHEKFEHLREAKLLVKHNAHEALANGRKRFYGIPQGLSISALLSNIYLIDYDRKMQEMAQEHGFLYRRYCDDILIVCDKQGYTKWEQLAKEEMVKHFQQMQDRKTEIIEFRLDSRGKLRAFDRKKLRSERPAGLNATNEQRYYRSLQYLGFEFTGQHILVRPGSISRYYRKMNARICKTITMAYSDKTKGDRVFRQQLLHRYTHLGKQNFWSYVRRASADQYRNIEGQIHEGMSTPAIRRQLRHHMSILQHRLHQKNLQRATFKIGLGKLKRLMATS